MIILTIFVLFLLIINLYVDWKKSILALSTGNPHINISDLLTAGVEHLSSLQCLDLAFNLLMEHTQLAPLAFLHSLNMVGKCS